MPSAPNLRRKEGGVFTPIPLIPLLFIQKSQAASVTSTSHQHALKDVPMRREGLNDWDNYLPTNDIPTRGRYEVKIEQRVNSSLEWTKEEGKR